jgi:uncharacterized membrane protein YhhN
LSLVKPGFFIWIYSLITISVIAGAEIDIDWLYYTAKPLLMVSLIVWFRTSVGKGRGSLVSLALVLCLLGDVMLMFDSINDYFFIAGLSSFLLAHVLYAGFFARDIIRSRPWNQHWFQMAISTLVLVYAVEFYILNREYFGALWSPVLLYVAIIAVMGITAALRDRFRPSEAYKPILTGALLFITSDSLLAVNKFVMELPFAGALVLTFYAAAQFLIVSGIISIYNHEKSAEAHN